VDTGAFYVLPESASASWATYTGRRVSLRYPADAQLVAASTHPGGLPGTAIRGPVARAVGPDSMVHTDRNVYELIVSEFENRAERTLDAWVDSLRAEANRVRDPDWRLAPPDTVTIGTHRALRLLPVCGDCAPEEYYFGSGDRIVVLSFNIDIGIPGDPDAQRRLYKAIMETLTWTRQPSGTDRALPDEAKDAVLEEFLHRSRRDHERAVQLPGRSVLVSPLKSV
jgi:hypothetical protein